MDNNLKSCAKEKCLSYPMKVKHMILLFTILISINFGLGKNLIIHGTYDPTSRELLDVEIVGNTLIIPGNLQGIEFYDIANPQTPAHLANLQLQGGGGGGNTRCYYARGSGNTVYVTTHRGVAIINISNPASPQFMGYISGTFGNNFILENMDISGNILAVCAHADGVFFYDISNPANPDLISTIQVENAWVITLYEDFAFIADGENIRILDITNIENPVEINSPLSTGNAVKDLAIANGLLYAALGSDGVSVFNVSTPAESPLFLGNYNTGGLANRIQPFEGKIAVSDWDDIEVLEWNGFELERVGFKANGRRTMAINTAGNYIYSAEWMLLQVFEFGEIPGADIDINSWELNYPYVENGDSYTLGLEVTNNGNSTLIVEDQYTTNPDFQIENQLQNLAPGQTQEVNITYNADGGNSSGGYDMFTNDNDESHIVCELNGNVDGINVGETAPDFELEIAANGTGTFQLSDHLGQIVVLAFFSPG